MLLLILARHLYHVYPLAVLQLIIARITLVTSRIFLVFNIIFIVLREVQTNND